MIDKELFLNLVQNHHHRGSYTDDNGSFCLLGACAVATNAWNDQLRMPSLAGYDFYRLKKALEIQIKNFTNNETDFIPEFNDFRGSHEDIMLVAKKAVAELNADS